MNSAVLSPPRTGRDAAADAFDPLPSVTSRVGEPTWEIAERMYPRQGAWSESEAERAIARSPVPVTLDDGELLFDADAERSSSRGEPTWEAAEFLHPRQGDWTEEEYLAVEAACEGTVEFVDGRLEFHAMADWVHADLKNFFERALRNFIEPRAIGRIYTSDLTVKLWPGRDRLPDVLLIPAEVRRGGRRYPTAADVALAAEVVSPDPESVERDHAAKRTEYAAAGIPEYWIVDATDPADPFVLVLTLPDGADEYRVHGEYRPGGTATSVLLDGFAVDVAALFAAADG